MAVEEIRVDDIGTLFEITIYDQDDAILDVSGATTKQIIFKKPSGGRLEKDAAFSTDGTDGKIRCVSVSGDLSKAGFWQSQGYVVLPDGEWRTTIDTFEVHANL